MGYVLSRVSAVTMCHHIWSCATTYGLRVVTYGSCVITLGYVLSHMGFQSPLQRPKGLFRTPHGLLGYQRSSALFQPVCLSVFNLSVYHLIANPIACASFPRLTHL